MLNFFKKKNNSEQKQNAAGNNSGHSNGNKNRGHRGGKGRSGGGQRGAQSIRKNDDVITGGMKWLPGAVDLNDDVKKSEPLKNSKYNDSKNQKKNDSKPANSQPNKNNVNKKNNSNKKTAPAAQGATPPAPKENQGGSKNNKNRGKKPFRREDDGLYYEDDFAEAKHNAPQATKQAQANSKDADDDTLYFFALGGMEHVGMNMYVYKLHGKYLIVDAGMGFLEDAHEGADTKYPDVSYLEKVKKDIIGMVITHGHEDHIGAMKYVWPKFRCPIFCTRFVEKILRMNFEELGIDEPYDIRVINHLGGKFETGPFQIENFHVSHSVPEAQMLIINSPQGKVLHTGDWTFNDGNPIEPMTDYARLKEIGSDPDLLACVCDSTEISRQPVQTTELEVQETLVKIFNEAPERVLLTTYSRSIARMKMLAEAAKRTGRVAAVKGRSLETFRQVAIDLGYIEEDDLMLYDDIKGLPMKQQVVMVTGSQGEKYAMLTRLCRGEVREMKLQQTDTVLFSAIIIPGNEKEVSQMYNKLAQIGAHVKTIFDTENLHANGHAGMPEFRRFYEMVHPFIAIPMHGEFVSEMLNAKMAVEVGGAKHMIVVKNGEMVALKRGSAPFITEHLHVGTIVLEGTHEYAGNDPVFATRKKIMLNGAVFITMPVDKKGFLKGVPEVSSAGIFESDPSSLMKRNIQIQITKAVDALDKNTRRNSKAFEQTVRQAVNGALRPIIGKQKKPNIIVHYVYK